MLTFQDSYQMAQEISGDDSATQLVMFKRDINEGATVFMNALGRQFNREYQSTDLEAGKQYYQFSANVTRISGVKVEPGTYVRTPILITNEGDWDRLNSFPVTGNDTIYYFIRGFNEVGLYPIPASTVGDGLTVRYEPQHLLLTEDDFTAGNVTVSNGSVVLTHSATGFLPQMVGRWIQINDGTDGRWYRIASYTSSSVLRLENYFEGISGTRTFRMGQVTRIPQGYQDGPVYYALDKYYLSKNDQNSAASFASRFKEKLRMAKATFANPTSQMDAPLQHVRGYHSWVDLPPAINYP